MFQRPTARTTWFLSILVFAILPVLSCSEDAAAPEPPPSKQSHVWQLQSTGVPLEAIWGSSARDVYAVGRTGGGNDDGVILHFDGRKWNFATSIETKWLMDVWGSSRNDVFAVGQGGTIVHYNGTSWGNMTSGTNEDLFGIWGDSGKNVFSVGSGGTLLHYDGTNWSSMTNSVPQNLLDVWGASGSDVFAVGESGTILHYGPRWK